MTLLTKQLEDKKKGCNVYISEVDNWCGYFNGNVTEDIKDYCPKCKEIIAILKQAIAEMQRQRKEILEIIDKMECFDYEFNLISRDSLKRQLTTKEEAER